MTTFIIPQLWTIFVEIVASIAIPGIAFAALYHRQWFVWLLTLALLVSFVTPNTYYHVTLYLVDFVVGAGLAIFGQAGGLFRNGPARSLVGVGLVTLACMQFLPLDYWSPLANLLEMAVAASIIGTLVGASEKVFLLRWRGLRFLGDISYSVYLLHFLVLCTVIKAVTLLQQASGIRLNIYVLTFALTCVTCAVTILLSWLTYVYVEEPGIEFGKRVLRFVEQPRGGAGIKGTAIP
jgi:peptidoglycan/LPS O-acetylase OafA/YrhL